MYVTVTATTPARRNPAGSAGILPALRPAGTLAGSAGILPALRPGGTLAGSAGILPALRPEGTLAGSAGILPAVRPGGTRWEIATLYPEGTARAFLGAEATATGAKKLERG